MNVIIAKWLCENAGTPTILASNEKNCLWKVIFTSHMASKMGGRGGGGVHRDLTGGYNHPLLHASGFNSNYSKNWLTKGNIKILSLNIECWLKHCSKEIAVAYTSWVSWFGGSLGALSRPQISFWMNNKYYIILQRKQTNYVDYFRDKKKLEAKQVFSSFFNL